MVKNNIANTLFGILFSLAILFPSIVKITHLFEDHEHIACTEIKQHIHEKKFDCEINDFQSNSFESHPFTYFNIATPIVYSIVITPCFSSFSSEKKHAFLLRGPPFYS